MSDMSVHMVVANNTHRGSYQDVFPRSFCLQNASSGSVCLQPQRADRRFSFLLRFEDK